MSRCLCHMHQGSLTYPHLSLWVPIPKSWPPGARCPHPGAGCWGRSLTPCGGNSRAGVLTPGGLRPCGPAGGLSLLSEHKEICSDNPRPEARTPGGQVCLMESDLGREHCGPPREAAQALSSRPVSSRALITLSVIVTQPLGSPPHLSSERAGSASKLCFNGLTHSRLSETGV